MLAEPKLDVGIQVSFVVNLGIVSPCLGTGIPKEQKWFCLAVRGCSAIQHRIGTSH